MNTTCRSWRVWTPCLLAGAAIGALALLPGCPGAGGPTPTPGDGLSGRIVNVTSNIRLSGDQTFTVVYDADPAATDVDAFFVQVESTDLNAPEIGPEVIFGNNIAAGTGQTINLNTSSLTVGIYRIGLRLSDGVNTLRVLSAGSIELTELAQPIFTLPNQNLIVQAGTAINIRVELSDPENAVQWRLFYIDANASTGGVPINELGTEIRTGTANVAIVTWSTGGVPLGTYRLGISVTDTGQSIDQTVESGQENRIVTAFNEFLVEIVSEPPVARPPSVVVSQPSSNRNILADEVVEIAFNVTVFEGPPSEQSITVFFDEDGTPNSGDETIISDNLPITATSAALSGSLLAERQTVRIGVTAEDGKNPPVTSYAAGRITRVRPEDATLTVTQPNSVLNRRPGDMVTVAWTTTLPTSAAAKYNVLVRRLNSAGQVVKTETNVSTTGLPLTQTTYNYAAVDPGRFKITVEAAFTDGTSPLRADAPQLVIVSTLPTIRWLGDLATTGTTARLSGAIFAGVQFEDNAGSAADGGEDFDGDDLDDFVIVARFGKPEFINPSGIGQGEAYLIRGRGTRYTGEINLNSVATSSVPGAVFTGLLPLPLDATAGISRVFISGDADGDGVGEVIFGFPWASSRQVNDLGGQNPNFVCGFNPFRPMADQIIPQFHRGGIVIVSSLTEVLSESSASTAGRRIPLDLVGQRFLDNFDGELDAIPVEGTLCGNDSVWLDDQWAAVDPECPEFGCRDEAIGCVWPSSDGTKETLIHPQFGFDGRLADPWLCTSYLPAFFFCASSFPDCPRCDMPCGPTDCGCDPLDPENLCPQNRELCEDGAIETCDPDYECTPTDDDPPVVRCECDEQEALFEETVPEIGLPLVDGFVFVPLVARPDGTLYGAPLSGFYRERRGPIEVDDGVQTTSWNSIVEATENRFGSVGARIIGRAVDDAAGASIAQSDTELIVVSPYSSDGAILDDGSNTEGGNAYFIRFSPVGGFSRPSLPRYWYIPDAPERGLNFSLFDYTTDASPVAPHQYLLGGFSHYGSNPESVSSQGHWDTNNGWSSVLGVRIIGNEGELIENLVAIPDFNGDTRSDVAIGAPSADIDGSGTPEGAVYVIFRRQRSLEGNYELAKLRLSTGDPNRLSGLIVRGPSDGEQRFGESVAGDFDFNHDGIPDVVVGNPDGNGSGADNSGATGEVVIIFGSSNTISQANGIPVDTEGSDLGLLARRQGARIRGLEPGSEFGYYVANIGDIDGDGLNDLAIAAPNASPYFDSNISDNNDSLDPAVNPHAVRGLDMNLDGIRDDVSGPLGFPDGSIVNNANSDANDELRNAGLVYIILSSTDVRDFATTPTGPMDISINKLGTNQLTGLIIVGRRGERFEDRTDAIRRYGGDFLGGGLAGTTKRTIPFNISIEVDYDGNPEKAPVGDRGIPRERSFGISKAGDVDGDGLGDFILGAQLADPRVDPLTGEGTKNGGEAYLIYGFLPD